MHPHEDIKSVADLTANEGDVLDAVDLAAKSDSRKVAEFRGKQRRGDALHMVLMTPAVSDEVGNRDEEESVLVSKGPAISRIHHRADVVHQFAQGTSGCQARETSEVDSGLGMTGTTQDPTGDCSQGHDMPRPREITGLGGRICEHFHRVGAILRRDSGTQDVARIDRDRIGRSLAILVDRGHRRKSEVIEDRPIHADADIAGCVANHERRERGGGR